MAKPFLCFNCKPRTPKWGENAWEITLTTVTILLFILSFVEIVALAQYSSVFSNSEVSACCGVIEEKSFSAEGAVCFERDIKDSHIEKFISNGSALCVVNDVVCEEFTYHVSGNMSDLETCLTTGSYPLTDVCGEQLLADQAQHKTAEAAAACIMLCLIILSITFFGICEYIGCFEDSCWCKNKIVNVINKLLEIIIWCILLIISQTVIENTAQNGYAAKRPPSSEARQYLYDQCEIENKAVMWVDFTLNMPDWLNSPGYQALAGVGVGLSILEFLLFFIVFDKQRKQAADKGGKPEMTDDKSPNVEDNMQKTIEMGGDTNTNTNTNKKETNSNNNNDETAQLETAETGNEDMGGSYRESDDDVLYDDEEKEMEYVTPGGPNGDTPQ